MPEKTKEVEKKNPIKPQTQNQTSEKQPLTKDQTNQEIKTELANLHSLNFTERAGFFRMIKEKIKLWILMNFF